VGMEATERRSQGYDLPGSTLAGVHA